MKDTIDKFLLLLMDSKSEYSVSYEEKDGSRDLIVVLYDGYIYRYDWITKEFKSKQMDSSPIVSVSPNEYFIRKEDIGRSGSYPIKTVCECCGAEIRDMVFEPLGKVLPQDVGKRCVKQNGVWYVENDSQFQKRIQK